MQPRLAWKREWTWILVVFLSLRMIYSCLGAVTVSNGEPQPLSLGATLQTAQSLLRTDGLSLALVNVWLRWDTAWFLKIATFGYQAGDGSITFMPLYPLLIRVAGFLLGGNTLLGAILVSNLAGWMALILFFELASTEKFIKVNPIQSVLALLAFPTAFFLFAAYSESLFLALVLAAFLSARHKRWWMAGILAGFATLCRLQGALLSPVLLWLYLDSAADGSGLAPRARVRAVWSMFATVAGRRQVRPSLLQPAGLAVLLPGMTLLAYLAWLKLSSLGDISQTLQAFWGIRTVMPWEGVRLFLERLFNGPRVFIDFIDLGALLFMLAVCIYATFRLDVAYSLYNWLNLGVFFMRGTPPHLLDSFSRYMLMLFPAFLVLGTLRNHRLALALGLLLFILQLFLVMGFLDWRWVA
jgi:hypothetical protein